MSVYQDLELLRQMCIRESIQRVFTNPVAAIIAVGVMVLPSLYAWFNIQASWDPYGSTDNISVAVSNVDEGTVVPVSYTHLPPHDRAAGIGISCG